MASSTVSNAFEFGSEFDFEKYLAHRPDYSASFYELIWTYHSNHGNNWNLAHDVGTGPGNSAKPLAERFRKIVASDPSAYHAAVARKNLTLFDNVTVEQCGAENLADKVGADAEGTVDMITLAECIPLMDAERAFSGFAKLLKPGGTLAVWFYGKPIFADKGQEQSQMLYNKIAAKAFERIYPIKGTPMQRAFTTLASWLDNIAFPDTTWRDVERYKWNHDNPLSFLDQEYFDFDVTYKSAVSVDDKIENKVDRTFWAKANCGIDWVEGFIDAQFPWKDTKDEVDAQLKPMYEQLEQAMGGKGSKVTITWPVTLLLATRR